ncbi:AAA domain-containing protein [Paraliobacillus sp. JSM ZJ581]|uniref:AAA domain-containing protein n=1 Tax=Paraliobacillus sp. JSM ZJ581 TaxID=3342118 RepID=UPI0035A8C12C
MAINKYDLAAKILKYWYLIEFLDQVNFPVESKENRESNKRVAEGEKNWYKKITLYHSFFPGEKNPTMAFEEDAQIYSNHGEISDEICICMGKISRGKCDKYLKRKFGLKDDTVEEDRSKICLIGLKCDSRGIYIEKSLSISPLIWGILRLQHHKGEISNENLAELLSLNDYSTDMSLMEEQLTNSDADGKRSGKKLSSELLQQLCHSVVSKYIFSLVESDDVMITEGVMIYKRYQSEEDKAKDSDSLYFSDLSNSFFTNDLHMILNSNILRNPSSSKDSAQETFIDYIVGAYAEEYPETKWIDFSKRIDIREGWNGNDKDDRQDFFNQYFDISMAPIGKWPSKYMPAFMQQLAINFGMHPEETGRTIFSVNGPPGTGKTTLLKEIIAGNLVERARLLVTYDDPDKAFVEKRFQDGDKSKNGYSKYHNVYYELKDSEIKKYGMLVASCNNAAVENITKELPDGTALCKGLLSDEKDNPTVVSGLDEVRRLFDKEKVIHTEEYKIWNDEQKQFCFESYSDIYFSKYANDMLDTKVKTEHSRWGIISAPFGKTSNIAHYAQKVLLPYIKDFGTNDKIAERKKKYKETVGQFKEQLEIVEEIQQRIRTFSHARRRFQEKKIELTQQYAHLMEAFNEIQQCIKQLQERAIALEDQKQEVVYLEQGAIQAVDSLQTRKEQQSILVRDLESKIQDIRRGIMELEGRRNIKDWFFALIGKVSMLIKTIDEEYAKLSSIEGLYKEHSNYLDQILEQMKEQKKLCNERSLQVQQFDREHKKAIERKKTAEDKKMEIDQSINDVKDAIEWVQAEYQSLLQSAKNTENILYQMTVLDESFWEMYDSKSEEENTKAQVLNPWFTVEYNREREKLFYLALQVHKNFLLASKSCFYNIRNLVLMWRLIEDNEGKLATFSMRDRENCFGPLLNTIFLLTPVLSTTFASVGSMLSDIKHQGELGLLIIDEAGQAQPQMALGALYRFQRAIVVGDPKQVEPVVTAEMDTIKKIIRNNENSLYQSKTHSVQEFADRINPIGTYYTDSLGDDKTWVGCPLVVHRRCISPMYEISNVISYDNTMKQQTQKPNPEEEARFCLESSRWINVCGTENSSSSKDHYVKTQGQKAIELILKAFLKTEEIPSLYVITPFTTVKDGLKKELSRLREYRNNQRIQDWARTHIGTVHTFQGKEADEVIFLLGCDKNALSAVRWVNTNIVNVAATRAKYRLYIIGDYMVWQHSHVMQQVKCIMDSYAIRALHEIAKHPELEANQNQVESLLKQVPTSEAFQVGDEISDVMVNNFLKAISDIWKNQNHLSAEELGKMGLSSFFMQHIEPKIKQNLIWGLKLYSLFVLLKERYGLDDMDYSCVGIMLCKAMELQLKDCLLPGFQRLFPTMEVNGSSLSRIRPEKAMVGVFTQVLKKESNQDQLAQRQVVYHNELCDKRWWDIYYRNLSDFRNLRNICCHPGFFGWDKVEALICILFTRDEFSKTTAGKSL